MKEKITNQEYLMDIARIIELGFELNQEAVSDKLREIAQAFAEKDKKIYELESEILSLRQDKAIVDNYVKELEVQVEKMKKAIAIRDRIME